MQKYPTYKPSNIDWIGEIPSHWGVVNFKHKITILTDFTANGSFASLADNVEYLESGFSRLVRLTDLRVNFENQGIYITEEAHNFLSKSELLGGELLIANVGAYAGLVLIMPETNQKMTLAPNMFMLRLNSNTKFYFYLLNSEEFKNHISMLAVSSAQPKLNKDNIKSLRILELPLSEQQAIVTYLDEKTTLIDELIAKKERKIELLKEQRAALINQAVTKGLYAEVAFKDSGIEWIGDIPEHWVLSKLNYLTQRIGDGIHSTPQYVDNSDYYFVNGNNLVNGKIQVFENTKCVSKEEYEKYFISLNPNDTVFLSINGTIGNIAFYNLENIILGKSACYIVCNEKLGKFFLYYLLQSNAISKYFSFELTGTTIYNLSLNSIRKTPIPLPSISEQQAIVAYLDEQTALIDKNIELESQKIEKLKEYRQSLISNVVTGKIKVA